MIYITGDLHGGLDYKRLNSSLWVDGKYLSRDDYLIVLGDFGLDACDLQPDKKKKANWVEWLNEQPWTTLFIDGNHEDFIWLESLEEKEWCGGKIGIAHENIFYLKRGEVFTIDGKTFFTMGGATSIDKYLRTVGHTWFYQEIPNYNEWDNAIVNLSRHGLGVDYVLSHTMPSSIAKEYLRQFGQELKTNDNEVEHSFQMLIENYNLEFKKWFCGHWHPDNVWGYKNYVCIYHDILNLATIDL